MLLAAPGAVRALGEEDEGWFSLFDGKTLAGWRASEYAHAFKVVDGQVVAQGRPGRLVYTGRGPDEEFGNFELSLEAMTRPGAECALWFHTTREAHGEQPVGLAVQVANSPAARGGFLEQRKTGSLYGVRNVYKQLVKDGEWLRLGIVARGRRVQVRINEMLVVDYVEAISPGKGLIALGSRGVGGAAHFKNIHARRLAEDAPRTHDEQPARDDVDREILRLGAENYPLVDYHVHLKGGLTIEQALANSRKTGIFYGVAINCGLGFPVHSDASVREYLASMKGQPCYVAMQAEGREWRTLASRESIAQFDYVFTDAMTFSDDTGKRMRIWLDDEVGTIADHEAFMEMLVKRIVGVLGEPIDIYANATFLPRQMQPEYDTLWTPERMQTVIAAAVRNDVAIEINNRYKIPSAKFIKAAKAAGAKFSFGTNNGDAELGRLEYPIQMVRECGLGWSDIFVPKPEGMKAIQTKK